MFKRWWRWWAGGAAALVAVALVIWLYGPFSRGNLAGAPASPTAAAALPPQTEAVFAAQFASSSVDATVLAEWRSARGDHKIIAYAIANCENFLKSIGPKDIDSMPRPAFSALMLDLTPVGDHRSDTIDAGVASKAPAIMAKAVQAASSSGKEVVGADAEPVAPTKAPETMTDGPFELTVHEVAVLHLSDAIARARLAAASGASGYAPKMWLLGWVTVGISAAATLFITIKSSMTAPPSAPPPQAGQQQPAAAGSRWTAGLYRFIFYTVGIVAMVLSVAVTALTGVKQFYDPLTAYKASEVALIGLKRLHNQVALDFVRNWDNGKCNGGPGDTGWSDQLSKHAALLGDYSAAVVAASATPLVEADFAWLSSMTKGLAPLPQPSATPP